MFFHVNKHYGPVAQLVEHSTLNRNVVGSNPSRSTTFPVMSDCQKFLTYFGDMLKSEMDINALRFLLSFYRKYPFDNFC